MVIYVNGLFKMALIFGRHQDNWVALHILGKKDEIRTFKGAGEGLLGRILSSTESFLGQDICMCMSSDGTFLSYGGAEFSSELRLSVTQWVTQQRMASVSRGFVDWKDV